MLLCQDILRKDYCQVYTPTLARPHSPWFRGGQLLYSVECSVNDFPSGLRDACARQYHQSAAVGGKLQITQAESGSLPLKSTNLFKFVTRNLLQLIGKQSPLFPRNSNPENAVGNLNMHKMELTNNSTIPGYSQGSDISAILSELSVNDRSCLNLLRRLMSMDKIYSSGFLVARRKLFRSS